MTDDVDGTVVFERSAGRMALEGVGAGCGSMGFLSVGLVALLGGMGGPIEIRLLAGAVFGFFGLLLGVGALANARRGGDPRVAEIGPGGAWLPGMDHLAWSEIEEVRLEAIRGVGGGDEPVTSQYRRLGFVPRDRTIKPDPFTSLGWLMARGFFGLVRRMAPEARFGAGTDDTAPFGVMEYEIPKDFERLVETARRYAPVVDAAEARARRRAGRWATTDPSTSVSAPSLGTLDAALGDRGTGAAAGGGSLPLVPTTTGPQPQGAFSVPAVTLVQVLLGILPVAAPLLFVPFFLPWALAGGPGSIFGLVFLGIFLAAFVVPGVVQLAGLARRVRTRRSNLLRLRVGPDGIWTRTSGPVPWSEVGDVRTERAGWAPQLGSPSLERWRLAFTTTSGATHGVNSDELDAPFDDILDLVRFYHPVVETS